MLTTIVSVVLLIIWLAALIDIIQRPMTPLMKAVWIVVVTIFPLIGVIVYFLIGRG